MNIAIFTDSFYPGPGGTENVIKTIVPLFEQKGDKVRIYCPDYHQKNQNLKNYDIFRIPSIKLTYCDMIALPSLVKGKLLRDLKQFQPDLIYFTTASGTAKWALKMGKKLNLPVIATLHTKFHMAWYESTKSHFITYLMLKSLVRKFNKAFSVTAVSFDTAKVLKSYGCKNEITVIKNGMDKKNLDITECSMPIKDNFIFLFCGRLIKSKQVQFSLKCLKNVKNTYNFNNFNFWIIGDGPYKKKLEKLVKKYDLQNNVTFLGYLNDRKLLNGYYNAANLMLFPSDFDCDSLVVLEASALQLPTLALKNYGCGERIEDNVTGFLSEFNEKAYTKRILEIINNKELYDKVRQNTSSLKAETWDEVSDHYREYFKNKIEEFKKGQQN